MQKNNACEHWRDESCRRYCEYVKHPPDKTFQEDVVEIDDLGRKLYEHQLIGGCLMVEQETGDCEGGLMADDMRLGKVYSLSHC